MPRIPSGKQSGISETISLKIRELRERAGLTQKELGVKLGYKEENAQAQIYQYETGIRSPSKKRLEQIAKIFSIPVETLIVNTANVYSSPGARLSKAQPTEFDKEVLLFKEEAAKYGVEGVRLARELLPVIFKRKGTIK